MLQPNKYIEEADGTGLPPACCCCLNMACACALLLVLVQHADCVFLPTGAAQVRPWNTHLCWSHCEMCCIFQQPLCTTDHPPIIHRKDMPATNEYTSCSNNHHLTITPLLMPWSAGVWGIYCPG